MVTDEGSHRLARIAGVEGERFVLREDHDQFPTTVTKLATRPQFLLRVCDYWKGRHGGADAWPEDVEGRLVT
jgi:hypothetical protein